MTRIERVLQKALLPLWKMDLPVLVKCCGCGSVGVINRTKPIKKQVLARCFRCSGRKVMKPVSEGTMKKIPGTAQMVAAMKASQTSLGNLLGGR